MVVDRVEYADVSRTFFFLFPAVKLTLLNAVGELCHRIMGMNAVVRSLIAVSLPPSTVLIDLECLFVVSLCSRTMFSF